MTFHLIPCQGKDILKFTRESIEIIREWIMFKDEAGFNLCQ